MTEQQENYFWNSKVRDSTGVLMPMYHGTGAIITEFDPDFTGQGNDQYGSGFYFTSKYSQAKGYMTATTKGADGQDLPKLGGNSNPNVVGVYLNLTNPYVIDGAKNAHMGHIEVSSDDAYRILLNDPDLFLPVSSVDSDIVNPLGDYFEDFWNKSQYTDGEYRQFIRRLADKYFNPTSLLMLDTFFGRHAKEFRQAARDALGHDGVIVHFGNGTDHAIAWFPNQIKAITNTAPTEANNIFE
ncbi:hypothetical protein [Flavonifractor sp. An306]|uniref:ADP-ribosyltransferase-containing protein n=1 Tax=Flavonifractor sp. An306 TaxID=1965629 RepID=UPI00174C303E|nr:hypothetical protein [Flavonifractor sp. An306]